jgi:hypothetical protein
MRIQQQSLITTGGVLRASSFQDPAIYQIDEAVAHFFRSQSLAIDDRLEHALENPKTVVVPL